MDIGYLAYVLGISQQSKERVKAELKQFTAELQSLDNITFNFDANAVKELTKEASGLQKQVEQVKNEFKEASKPVDEFDAELKALLQTAGNLKSLRVTGLIDTSEYKRDLEATKTQLIDFANELGTASAQAQPLIKAAADLEKQLQGLYQEELRATQQTEKLQAEFAKNSARGTAETYTDLRARLSQLLDETSRGVNTTEDAAKAFRNLADEARRLSPALEADAKAFTQFNNLSRQAVSAADRVEGKVNRLSFANQVLAGNARVAVNSLTGYGPAGIIADTALDSIIAGSGGAATASLGLAAGIGAVVAGAVALDRVGADSFKSLQSSIAQLKANGVDDIEAVRAKIEQIQDQSKIFRSLTEAEYASATAEIVRANRSAAESLDILRGSVVLAVAEGSDLNETSLALSTSLRQFGESTALAEDYAGKFAKAGNLANTAASNFAVGVGESADQAALAGFTIDELLGVLVEIDNKGFNPAEKGARGFNSILSALASPSKQAQAGLKELGVSLTDVEGKARPIRDVFFDVVEALQGNTEAVRIANTIFENFGARTIVKVTDEAKNLAEQIQDSDGFLQTFKETAEDTNRDLSEKGLLTAITDLGAAFSELINPALVPFLDSVTGAINRLNDAIDRRKPDDQQKYANVQKDIDRFESDLAFQQNLLEKNAGAGRFGGVIGLTDETIITQIAANNEKLAKLYAEREALGINLRLSMFGSGEDATTSDFTTSPLVDNANAEVEGLTVAVTNLKSLNDELKGLKEEFSLAPEGSELQKQLAAEINALQARIDVQEDLISSKTRKGSKSDLQKLLENLAKATGDYQEQVANLGAAYNAGLIDQEELYSEKLKATDKAINTLVGSYTVLSDSQKTLLDSLISSKTELQGFLDEIDRQQVLTDYQNGLSLINAEFEVTGDKAAALSSQLGLTQSTFDKLLEIALSDGVFSDSEREAIQLYADSINNVTAAIDALPEKLSALELTQRYVDKLKLLNESGFLSNADLIKELEFQKTKLEGLRNDAIAQGNLSEAADIQARLQAITGLADTVTQAVKTSDDALEQLRQDRIAFEADENVYPSTLSAGGVRQVVKNTQDRVNEIALETARQNYELRQQLKEIFSQDPDADVYPRTLTAKQVDELKREQARNFRIAEQALEQEWQDFNSFVAQLFSQDPDADGSRYPRTIGPAQVRRLRQEVKDRIDDAKLEVAQQNYQYREYVKDLFSQDPDQNNYPRTLTAKQIGQLKLELERNLRLAKQEVLRQWQDYNQFVAQLFSQDPDGNGNLSPRTLGPAQIRQLINDVNNRTNDFTPTLDFIFGTGTPAYTAQFPEPTALENTITVINSLVDAAGRLSGASEDVANFVAGLQESARVGTNLATAIVSANPIAIVAASIDAAGFLIQEAFDLTRNRVREGIDKLTEEYDLLNRETIEALAVTERQLDYFLFLPYYTEGINEKATSFGLGIAESVAEGFKRGLIGTDADFKAAFNDLVDNLKAEAIIQLPEVQTFIAEYSRTLRDALADGVIDAAEQANLDALYRDGEERLRRAREAAGLNRPTDINQTDNLAPIQTSTFNLPTGGLSVSESFSWTGEMANIINNFRSGVDKFVEGTSRFANTATNLDARLATLLRT